MGSGEAVEGKEHPGGAGGTRGGGELRADKACVGVVGVGTVVGGSRPSTRSRRPREARTCQRNRTRGSPFRDYPWCGLRDAQMTVLNRNLQGEPTGRNGKNVLREISHPNGWVRIYPLLDEEVTGTGRGGEDKDGRGAETDEESRVEAWSMLAESDRVALEQAYRELGDELWRAVLAYSGGSHEVADEAVAEAFAQAGRRLPHIRMLRSWLYAVAFRIARGEMKRASEHLSYDPDSEATAADLEGSTFELVDLLRLSPMQRGAFYLREVLGYPGAETAEILGTTPAAVRVHLHYARKRMREVTEKGLA